ncbi:hypothetical protein K503DRAFT_619692 [Rhizopogon vinicolor AM-OR11-026]|uniref:Uncharacterized protein n=1 Tax=Rhizopogon vinicolor AM-OR11-026 TaxID=1314800 RepID=A0A1B7N6D0_9AGAM|nr:hypothetical protein K503DRAFT_619692 [Rhizopogon vinicolor AM-OR11-026]
MIAPGAFLMASFHVVPPHDSASAVQHRTRKEAIGIIGQRDAIEETETVQHTFWLKVFLRRTPVDKSPASRGSAKGG